MRVSRFLTKMADGFFSSSWGILQPDGCAGSRRCFGTRAIVEARPFPGLRGWLEVELDEDAEQLIDELADA